MLICLHTLHPCLPPPGAKAFTTDGQLYAAPGPPDEWRRAFLDPRKGLYLAAAEARALGVREQPPQPGAPARSRVQAAACDASLLQTRHGSPLGAGLTKARTCTLGTHFPLCSARHLAAAAASWQRVGVPRRRRRARPTGEARPTAAAAQRRHNRRAAARARRSGRRPRRRAAAARATRGCQYARHGVCSRRAAPAGGVAAVQRLGGGCVAARGVGAAGAAGAVCAASGRRGARWVALAAHGIDSMHQRLLDSCMSVGISGMCSRNPAHLLSLQLLSSSASTCACPHSHWRLGTWTW